MAGFTKSLNNEQADWNLDALLPFANQVKLFSLNDNYYQYIDDIKDFSPDLIISDLEIYTSLAALELHIPLWQVSPILLYYGLQENRHKLNAHYSFPILKDQARYNYINSIIKNADKRLIPSHLGDMIDAPSLKDNFEWVRPSFEPPGNYCDGTAISLADFYFNNITPEFKINYDDEEVLINYHLHQKYRDTWKQLNINPGIKFLSQYLNEL